MGVSTDAILAYGVDLGDEDELVLPWLTASEDDDDDSFDELFERWVAELAGVESADATWATYETFLAANPDLSGEHAERMDAWERAMPGTRAKLDALREATQAAVTACPIELVPHCHHDAAMWIVAVRGSVTVATRGNPERLPPVLELPADAVAGAVAFCAEHGIPFDEPSWLLASYWG